MLISLDLIVLQPSSSRKQSKEVTFKRNSYSTLKTNKEWISSNPSKEILKGIPKRKHPPALVSTATTMDSVKRY